MVRLFPTDGEERVHLEMMLLSSIEALNRNFTRKISLLWDGTKYATNEDKACTDSKASGGCNIGIDGNQCIHLGDVVQRIS